MEPRYVPDEITVTAQIAFNPSLSSNAKVLFGLIHLYLNPTKKTVKKIADICCGMKTQKVNKLLTELEEHNCIKQHDEYVELLEVRFVPIEKNYGARLDLLMN